MIRQFLGSGLFRVACSTVISVGVLYAAAGCSVAATNERPANEPAANAARPDAPNAANSAGGAKIQIDPNGPADTVRVFYKYLREKKFRDAIFLTNLRPAIEGLTEAELKEFALDLETLAGQVPAEIQINGEIVSGDNATVTANLPNPDEDGKYSLQEIKLKRENGVWIIQTVDEAAEKRIKAEGKQYFFNLRIETHEDEARKMLERIAKAEIAYSLQNGGICAEINVLIEAGLLPEDIRTSQSTGYDYVLKLSENKRRYHATATPAEYGKSGRLSFLLQPNEKGIAVVTNKDNGGKPMK